MSVTISMHGTSSTPTTARANTSGGSAWLEFSQGVHEVTIFGDLGQIEKFRMAADILNDAFAKEAEPTPAASPSDDDDLPF